MNCKLQRKAPVELNSGFIGEYIGIAKVSRAKRNANLKEDEVMVVKHIERTVGWVAIKCGCLG